MSLVRGEGIIVVTSSANIEGTVHTETRYDAAGSERLWQMQRQDSWDCVRGDAGAEPGPPELWLLKSPPRRQVQSSSTMPLAPTHASAHQSREPRLQNRRMAAMVRGRRMDSR